MSNELIWLSEASKAIAKVATVGEAKSIADKAAAIRIFAAKQNWSAEQRAEIAEIEILSVARLGELLEPVKRGRPAKNVDGDDILSLEDLGITRDQSSRAKKVASIPAKERARYISENKLDGTLSVTGLVRIAKSAAQKRKRSQVESGTKLSQSLPEIVESGTRFSCIYADPPWQYSNQATRASTKKHYDTLTVPEICALPVPDLVADEALLFLWTTNGFLFESKAVIEAWGFEFKSSMVWVKPQIGIGNYVRNSHEFLLIASRGGMTTTDAAHRQKSWIEADRIGHSAKPRIFREVVERISYGPRIELFGREQIPNWTVWGNQISDQKRFLMNGAAR